MKRILFVDDEPRLLDALQRMLRPLHRECDMPFATSGAQALEMLAGQPFDLVVTDIRMPGMDGSELLAAIRERHPEITRIILSGTTDLDITMKSIVAAHQFLSKPCDAQTLRDTIRRALAPPAIAAPMKRILSRMAALPSVPSLYRELTRDLAAVDPDMQRVARIVEQDPGMTAKMLQLVNSACFGYRRHIQTPAEAVAYLGPETMSKLVLSAGVFSEFVPTGHGRFCVDTFWHHSLATSALAWKIAVAEGGSLQVAAEALLAGLLHDSGKLVFATQLSTEYDEVLEQTREGIGEIEAERQVFGASHAEAGAYLLWLWGLPEGIVEAVAFHHEPAACPGGDRVTLTAVHAADVLEHERGGGAHGFALPRLDLKFLNQARRADRVPAWRGMLQTVV